MASKFGQALLRHIRRAVQLSDLPGQTDGQLLDGFLDHQDEAAFEALVRRHGRMVLGVCRRVLGNVHDAEDAFQATFLVLVRKAGSIVPRASVGHWLYGVAYRTALKARAVKTRRQVEERRIGAVTAARASVEQKEPDWLPLLDEELNRLPKKYQTLLVLCDLEGRSRKEVAQQLGLREGTLSSRLARGRELLRRRLTRRGVALTTGSLLAVLVQQAAAAVPVPLLATLMPAAVKVAAGQALAGVVSAQIITLTEGVLHAMWMTKLKVAAVLVLTGGIVTGGAGVLSFRTLDARSADTPKPAAKKPETPRPPLQDNPKIKELLKARLEAAKVEWDARDKEFHAGRGTLEILLNSATRLLNAQLEVSTTRAERLAAYEEHLERMKVYEKENKQRYEDGRIPIQDKAHTDYERLDAEIRLERAKLLERARQEAGIP